MLKMFKHFGKLEWLQVVIALIFIVLQVWLDLKLPDYMATITQLTQTPGSQMSEIWEAGVMMLACALGSMLTAVVIGYLSARIGAMFSKNVRSALFNQVTNFSLEEINLFSTSSLITRSTNDVTQVQLFITLGLQMLIKAPIMAVWALIKIYGKGESWTYATVIAVTILIAIIALIMAFVTPKFRQMQTLTDNVNRIAREHLNGLSVVRAYNAEDYQEAKFQEANDDLTNTQLFTGRTMGLMMPATGVVMNVLSLVIYWMGAYLIDAANMGEKIVLFSNMVVFSSYAMQVIMSFMLLSMMFVMLPRASVSAERISEVLETKPAIHDGEIDNHAETLGSLTFKNVNFRYPDAQENALHNINFSINKGETLAFIGATGSRKTTILNLIARLYDATDGEIMIDGHDIKDYHLDILHEKIAYVPQKSVLFSGTLASNIAFGERRAGPFSEDEVVQALEIAQGSNIAEKSDEGMLLPIAQGGANLSGGQKQRVTIARAIARQPEFYLFDDSFSALDFKTERALREALNKETAGVTTIIVAQRIGTIMDADKIIVIDQGAIAGMGTHEELLETCDIYQEIAISQLSEEELRHG